MNQEPFNVDYFFNPRFLHLLDCVTECCICLQNAVQVGSHNVVYFKCLMHSIISIIFEEFSTTHVQFIFTPDFVILGPDELSKYIRKEGFPFVLSCIDDERDPSFLNPELERDLPILELLLRKCWENLYSILGILNFFLPENLDAFKEKLFQSDAVQLFLSGQRYDNSMSEINNLSLAEEVFMQFTERHLYDV